MSRWSIEPRGRGLIQAIIVALALVSAPAGPVMAGPPTHAHHGATGAIVAEPGEERDRTQPVLGPLTGSERQGYGCLIGGGTALALSALGGPTETILVVTGGTLVPTGSLLLWTALTGTVVASVCAASALVAPVAVRLWDYYYLGMRPAPETAAEIAAAADQ